jgi:hypothetical protein
VAVTIGQAGFRLRNDDGSETTATWKAAQNTNVNIAADLRFRVRFLMQNAGITASNNVVAQLEYTLNGGASTNVTGASTVVRSSASPNVTDAANITQQLTGGTGTFQGLTGFDEADGAAGGASLDIAASGCFEVEYSIVIRSADVTSGDTIGLRVTAAGTDFTGTYAQVPAIVVTKPIFSVFDTVATAEFIDVDCWPRIDASDDVAVSQYQLTEIAVVITVSDATTVVVNAPISGTKSIDTFDSIVAAESIIPRLLIQPQQNESVTSQDLSNQEINYWIIVSDSTTVVVTTPAGVALTVNTFDTVTIAEAITLTSKTSLTQFDSVTAAEAIVLNVLEQPNVFDAVATTEVITPRLLIQPQPFETVSVAESITLTGNLSLSQFDAAALTESFTVSIGAALPLTLNTFDPVTIAEAITPKLFIQPITFDAVAAAESITLTGNTSVNQFESVTVAELITLRVFHLFIGTGEDVTVAESITVSMSVVGTLQIITAEALTLTELGQALLTKLFVTTFDTATAAESIAVVLPVLFLSVFDSTIATEDLTIQLVPRLTIDTNDSVTAIESVTVSMTVVGTLPINTFDAVILAELAQGLLTKLFITTFDAVTAAEAATIITTIGGINLFDSIAVAELASLQFSRLLIAADEAISIAEQVNLAFVAPLQIAVGDDVRLLSIPPIDITTLSDAITVSDAVTVTGPLVWASVGSLGSASSKSANQSTLTLITTAPFEVGAFAVVLIAVDNFQTTDGDENAITSVIDSAGNVYIEAREFTNGQGAAQGGATVSVRYCTAAVQLNTGGTITVSFANATSRDASAITAFKFSTTVAGVVSVAGSAVLANDGSDPGSMDLTLPSGEYLWVRAQAHERPSTDTFTKTVAYGGTFDKNGTTGGTAATNMTVAGEWDLGLVGISNPTNPAWSAAADEAAILVAFRLDPALAPSMVENVGLTELVAAFLPKLFINENEPLVIAEIITLQLGGLISNIPVSVNEPVTLAEVVAAALSRLSINANDAVTVAEFISNGAAVQNLSIELGDAVATTENIIFRGTLSISASDTVFLFAVAPNAISVVENLTVTDFAGALGPTTVGLNILVFENVVVDIPETGVFESIAVGELAQVIGTGIDWFSIGSLGSISSNSADQSSIVLQTGAIAEVSNVVVLLIAVDNAATTDGDEGAITGVSDAAGNNWVEIGEFCNANAAPQAGATIAAWYSLITTQIPLNALITVGFSNPASRDASALTAWEFGRRNSGAVTVAAVTTLSNDTSDPGLMNLALGAGEHLWVRAQAHEGPLSDVWIKTIQYDGIFDKQGTTGGTATSNMTVAAEFRVFQGGSNPSDPSWTAAADEAGMLFALKLSASLAPIAADSVTIAEIATLALARLIISVNDVATVLEAVTLKQTANLSVFEAVSVTDFSAVANAVRLTGFDAVTLTELIALTSSMSISASDTVTVADFVGSPVAILLATSDNVAIAEAASLTVQLTVSAFEFVALAEAFLPSLSAYLTVFDSVAVTDAVTAPTVSIVLNAFDSVTLAEASTVLLPKLVLTTFDNVTPTDVSALFVQGTAPAPPVGEFVNAIDDATVSINRLTVSQLDTVAVAEAISLSVSVNLTVFDQITTADAAVMSLPLTVQGADTVTLVEFLALAGRTSIAANDTVTLAEVVTLSMAVNLTVFDTVTASESVNFSNNIPLQVAESVTAFEVALLGSVMSLTAGDDVVVAEQSLISTGAIVVAVQENLTITEVVGGSPALKVTAIDTVTLADTAAAFFLVQTIFIEQGDAINAQEEINQEVRGEGALATELVAVDDFASLLIDRLKIAMAEDVAAIEDLTGRLSCYVSLSESVSVADDAAYIFHGQELFINLGEDITVSDRFLTNLSLLKIVEVMSEIALELSLESEIATDLDLTSEINQDIDLEGEIEL